jgi:hypothetical protein
VNDTTHVVELPPVFYDDHVRRNWMTAGEVVEILAKTVKVRMAEHEIGDLYSDARHYAQHSEMDLGLRSSARATVRRLEKQFGVDACQAARRAFQDWERAGRPGRRG